MGGEEVLRRLPGAGKTMPVLILTAKDAIPDRVANLNAGADDYLVKPFSFSELVARIRARLRVTDQPTATVLERNGVTLDLTRREVRRPRALPPTAARDGQRRRRR